jgi:hypothetical protein
MRSPVHRHQHLERRIIGELLRVERVDVGRGDAQYLGRVGRPGDAAECQRQKRAQMPADW